MSRNLTSHTVFLFPGQGSQYFKMGHALFEEEPVFRREMLALDRLARQRYGLHVLDAVYDPAGSKSVPFDNFQLSNPAIFMVEYALARTLIEGGVVPSMTLGASVGSFAAAAIAGCIEVEDALRIVCELGQFCRQAAPAGAMIAVLGEASLLQDPALRERCVLASDNLPKHFVLSTRAQHIPDVEQFLRSRDVGFQRLPVNYPFHSPWMEDVRAPFLDLVNSIPTRRAAIPLVCCAQAQPLFELSPSHVWDFTRLPIRFRDTIAALEAHGNYRYIDIGPAPTLATFLKYLLPQPMVSSAWPTMSPFGQDRRNVQSVLQAA